MARTAKRYKKNTKKKLLYITFILIWEKPEQILTDRDLNG